MFAKLAVSVTVGFLGAYPLALSSGIMESAPPGMSRGPFVFTSGIILFFLTLALIGPTIRLVRQVLETLGRVEERPKPQVAAMMLVLGAFCAISSMVIALIASNRPPASLSMNIPGFNAETQVVAQPSGSVVLGLLTVLTFVLGAALIGLGIWASVKPSPPAVGRMVKPEVPELQEVAT